VERLECWRRKGIRKAFRTKKLSRYEHHSLKKEIETDKTTAKNLSEELAKAKEVERKVSERKTIEEEILKYTEELNQYTEMLDASKAELKVQFTNTGFLMIQNWIPKKQKLHP